MDRFMIFAGKFVLYPGYQNYYHFSYMQWLPVRISHCTEATFYMCSEHIYKPPM